MAPTSSKSKSKSKSTRKSKSTGGSKSTLTGGTPEPAVTITPATLKRQRLATRFNGKSNAEVLVSQREGWTSTVYKHFDPPTIVEEKGKVYYEFKCKRNPSKVLRRQRHEDSTTNLRRHVQSCEPTDSTSTQQIVAFANGTNYSASRFRYLLSMWCARHHRPFLIVQDEELVEIFKMLYSRVDIPSRFTLSRDIREIFFHCRENVSKILAEYPGKLHFGVDGWSSPNVFSFLGITVHRCVKGAIVEFILDYIKLTSSHTGVYLAEKFAECLRSYKLESKILSLVCDNAENNSTMVTALEALLPAFKGKDSRIRCFGHVLNLVVKAILSQFAQKRKGPLSDTDKQVEADLQELREEEDEEDAAAALEVDSDREAFDELMLEEVDDELAGDVEIPELTVSDINLGRFSVHKITNLSKKVFNNPAIREELGKLCTANGLKAQVLLRSVPTRWNSVAEMLGRALTLRTLIGELCDMAQFNKRDGVRLRRFILEDDEWTLLEQLFPLLDMFLFVTKQVSNGSSPRVHQVIPYIDSLNDALDDFADNTDLLPAVRMAARRGSLLLNKYYGKTDESIVFRIAMILNPAYKTTYFRQHKWPEDWIITAVDLLRKEWTENYKPKDLPMADVSNLPSTVNLRNKYFNDILKPTAGSVDALDLYLASPTVPIERDPLLYWDSLDPDHNPLARMASDYLSSPAASTDVERSFSRGRLNVSRLRHSLSDQSTRAATVLGSWADIPGLVPRNEIIENIRNKGARWAVEEFEGNHDAESGSEDSGDEKSDDGMEMQVDN